ncbi:MAG TPA: hypothetical protein VHV51_24835 [Polyangiaceae bacterium]|jgi:hypothetical protein|nr:hypothetical protein [Polyangiaceae bacterium]
MSAEMRAEHEIDLASDLASFFQHVVDDVMKSQAFEATEAAEYYLAQLLADYAKPEKREAETLDRPLTILLDEALHSAGSERFERLRCLGDGVLYTSGFFADHLSTRGVELRYVCSLGARAYDGAAVMLNHGAREAPGAPDVFRELADNFATFAEIVSRVADALQVKSAHNSDRAVLRMYERWTRTGSAPLAAALAGRGLTPQRGHGGLH